MENTLLLTAGFEPIKVISWRKAVTLVVLNKVEVLEAYHREVRSPSLSLRLPAVIKLTRFFKPVPRRVRFSRQNLFFRDNYTCQYCHTRYPSQQLTYDHIVPRSRGGKTSWTNVVTSCVRCNLRKGNKPLQSLNFGLLKQPREPRWLPHFAQIIHGAMPHPIWETYLSHVKK